MILNNRKDSNIFGTAYKRTLLSIFPYDPNSLCINIAGKHRPSVAVGLFLVQYRVSTRTATISCEIFISQSDFQASG